MFDDVDVTWDLKSSENRNSSSSVEPYAELEKLGIDIHVLRQLDPPPTRLELLALRDSLNKNKLLA